MIFRPELAKLILEGKKTATRRRINENPRSPWRDWPDDEPPPSYPVGKRFTINPGRGVDRIAEAEVTDRHMQQLCNVSSKEAREEGAQDLADFVDIWKGVNGSMNASEYVHVIEFKLVGPDCMGCDGTGWCEGSPAFDCPDCFATGIEPTRGAKELIARLEDPA